MQVTASSRFLRKAKNNHIIAIDGLWGLHFGNGTTGGASNELFFTSGPDGEEDGLFGKLTMVAPVVSSKASVAASAQEVIAMGDTTHVCEQIGLSDNVMVV